MSPIYETVVAATLRAKTPDAIEVRGNLEGAIRERDRLRLEYPTAEVIFIRRKSHNGKEVVLHKYTVHHGSTADERRAIATASVLAISEARELQAIREAAINSGNAESGEFGQ